MDGIFSAGLVDHVPDPVAALREWARVTAPDGILPLFHPSGRAERAARHGRSLDPADLPAGENLRPALRAADRTLARYEDTAHHFLARAVRDTGRHLGRLTPRPSDTSAVRQATAEPRTARCLRR
uniref:methyltransferase domain-containing protein n=1 Tax=Streptomyces asoensis TaxID=249586 RepID=UPI00209C0FEE|nr:methyltransferase domain-containing protein [Streptomyces asoensis]